MRGSVPFSLDTLIAPVRAAAWSAGDMTRRATASTKASASTRSDVAVYVERVIGFIFRS